MSLRHQPLHSTNVEVTTGFEKDRMNLEPCYTVLILRLSIQFSGNLLLLKFASVGMMKH